MRLGPPEWRKAVVGALAIATMALAPGCGASSKPLTRAQLIAKADAICKRVTTRLQASGANHANTPAQLERLAKSLATYEQSAFDELGALVPPAALEADWKRFVAGAQTLAESTTKLSQDLATKARAKIQALITSAEATQKQMVAIAKRDGMKACEQVA